MSAWEEVAARLRQLSGGGLAIERYVVRRTTPLTLEQIDGEELLEEGDPDFTLGDTVRQQRTLGGIEPGSIMRVAAIPEPDGTGFEWYALDVMSDSSEVPIPSVVAVTVDGGLRIASPWGISGSDPYYDPDGAEDGEEAMLLRGPDYYVLRSIA